MRLFINTLLFFLFINSLFSQSGSVSQSWSGNGFANLGMYDAVCTGPVILSVNLPMGENIRVDSVTLAYTIQASNGLSPNFQRSQITCLNNNLSTSVYSGTITTINASETYTQTNIQIANGTFTSATTLQFEFKPWKTVISGGNCNNDQSLTSANVIVYYTAFNTPKVGINTSSPQAVLDVKGKLRISEDNAPDVSGSIKYDTTENDFKAFDGTQWFSLRKGNGITDNDQDTKIDVERYEDEDRIRFTIRGIDTWIMDSVRLTPFNNSIFIGKQAGRFNAPNSIAIGDSSLSQNLGFYNSAVGINALQNNTTGDANSAFGLAALRSNTTGYDNSAFGKEALYSNITGWGNAAFGSYALSSNTNGAGNSAFGVVALYRNTTGNGNSAFGYDALWHNTSGSGNSAFGYDALFENTTGYDNSAFGLAALNNNTIGYWNSAFGNLALVSNKTGNRNSAFGKFTLSSNISGSGNSAFGYYALNSSSGDYNSAFGDSALSHNTSGTANSAFGTGALYNNTESGDNSAFGSSALVFNTIGNSNSAFGSNSLSGNTTGSANSAFGVNSLSNNTNGFDNSSIGFESLFDNTSGDQNTAIGTSALRDNTTGNNNTSLGHTSMPSNINGSNNTALGFFSYTSSGSNYSNSTAVGYLTTITSSAQVRIGNTAINSIGGYEPWTNLSDGRFKKNIKDNVVGLDFINQLKPVTYQIDVADLNEFLRIPDSLRDIENETNKSVQIRHGFLAQEVEAVANSLGFNFNGVDAPKNENDHYGLRYSVFVVPLVKAVQELSDENHELHSQIDKQMELIIKLSDAIEKLESKVDNKMY